MTDFWAHLGPWLLIAVLVPAAILLGMATTPGDAWSEGVIRRWADSQDLKVSAIEDAPLYDVLRCSNLTRPFRVRVVDRKGRERACKAVVGRLILRPTAPNLAITWIKAR